MYNLSVHFVVYCRSDGWGRKSSIDGHCSIKSGESMATLNPIFKQILVKFETKFIQFYILEQKIQKKFFEIF